MSTHYCDYSDLPVMQCAHCRGHARDLPKVFVINAKFPGQCMRCPDEIRPGDRITPIDQQGFAHEGCA